MTISGREEKMVTMRGYDSDWLLIRWTRWETMVYDQKSESC